MELDVLIPAYNAEKTIRDSIVSIQKQTLSNIQIIAIDDGSTDRTGTILRELADEDRRISYLRQENSGIVSALNAGLVISSAPFIARHDADDLADPHRLETQLRYLKAHSDCIAVGANARHIDEEGAPTGYHTTYAGDVEPNAYLAPAEEPYLMHPLLFVRSDAMRAVGAYRYALHAEDTDLYWRLLGRGRLHNLADVLGSYRLHVGGITSSSIYNGRIGALFSQLAAISYRRRQQSRPDLAFPASNLHLLRTERSAVQLLECCSVDLTLEESRYLKVAFAAKLLELASYRKYLLSYDDCRFIGESLLRHYRKLDDVHWRRVKWHAVANAVKLLRNTRLREVSALRLPPSAYSQLAGRLAKWPLRSIGSLAAR